MPNRSSSQQIQRPQWDRLQQMQLIRLVKVHYLVPQLARQDLLKCRQLMVHSLKVQMAVLDRRDQVQIQALDLTFLQVHSKDL